MKEARTSVGRMKRIDTERGSKGLREIAKYRASMAERERAGGTDSTRVAK